MSNAVHAVARQNYFGETDVLESILTKYPLTEPERSAMISVLDDRRKHIYCRFCSEVTRGENIDPGPMRCTQCNCRIDFIET